MTVVLCLMSECRGWLNGGCGRRTVKVVGMKCVDFTRRKSQFRHKTTTITCDQQLCKSNVDGTCKAELVVMGGEGCRERWLKNIS